MRTDLHERGQLQRASDSGHGQRSERLQLLVYELLDWAQLRHVPRWFRSRCELCCLRVGLRRLPELPGELPAERLQRSCHRRQWNPPCWLQMQLRQQVLWSHVPCLRDAVQQLLQLLRLCLWLRGLPELLPDVHHGRQLRLSSPRCAGPQWEWL